MKEICMKKKLYKDLIKKNNRFFLITDTIKYLSIQDSCQWPMLCT